MKVFLIGTLIYLLIGVGVIRYFLLSSSESQYPVLVMIAGICLWPLTAYHIIGSELMSGHHFTIL